MTDKDPPQDRFIERALELADNWSHTVDSVKTAPHECRSILAHARTLQQQEAQGQDEADGWERGMRDAANICGSLAETTYDDADAFEAATGCEAEIVKQLRMHQCNRATKPQQQPQADWLTQAREALEEARAFIDGDSPDWRYAKQEQLAKIDAALEKLREAGHE